MNSKKKYFKQLASFSCLLVCTIFLDNASAFPGLGDCNKKAFQPYSDLIQKVAVMGSDERLTYGLYARKNDISIDQVNKTFGATGFISCDDNHNGTAQITEDRSVITTSRHIFFKKDKDGKHTCEPLKYKSCKFFVEVNGGHIAREVNLSNMKMGECSSANWDGDWAVLQLDHPVPKVIQPYRVPQRPTDLRFKPDVIHVGGYASNFKIDNDYPRYITECKIQDIQINSIVKLQTDCDSGGGSSGSAQLQNIDGQMTMVSMHIAHQQPKDGEKYDRFSNYNFSVEMSGQFRDAVITAIQEISGKARVENDSNYRRTTKASAGSL